MSACRLPFESVEEVPDVDAENVCDLIESPRRDPVEAGLILMGLLLGHPDQICHLLLCKPVHDSSLAQARADVPIDVLGSRSTGPKAPIGPLCIHSVRSPALLPLAAGLGG